METIRKLYNEGNTAVDEMLDRLTEDELSAHIDTSANTDPELLEILFSCASLTSEAKRKRVAIVYKSAVKLLVGTELTDDFVAKWVDYLSRQAQNLTPEALCELINVMTNFFRSTRDTSVKWLDLFPLLLQTVSKEENLFVEGDQVTGSTFKSNVLKNLCSLRWKSRCAVTLASMFRDILMTVAEAKMVCEKLLGMMEDLSSQEIPPFVYQLLLLPTLDCKRIILAGVLEFFNKEDLKLNGVQSATDNEIEEIEGRTKEELRQMEGTVILHITFAMTQDKDFRIEFIRHLKKIRELPRKILTPFIIGLGLSVSTIHGVQDSVFDSITHAINLSFLEVEYYDGCAFVRKVILSPMEVDEPFTEALANCSYDWDYVTQGFVEFGFLLMDSNWKTFGRQGKNPTNALGMKILSIVFKGSDMTRKEILERLLNHIITKGSSPSGQYLTLFAEIVKTYKLFVLESTSKLQQVFQYLPLLPLSTAQAFIKAICPLLRISVALKDSLVIVLRKAMFSRELEARKIGISGFLLFLKNFKILGGISGHTQSQHSNGSLNSSSLVFADVHTKLSPEANEALCFELLGSLRRCLSQQAEIRCLIYEGLLVILKQNNHLCGFMLDILHSHFLNYYEVNENIASPLKCEKLYAFNATGEAVLKEPLGQLLFCMQACLREGNVIQENNTESENFEQNKDTITRVENSMNAFVLRMINANLDDFELERSDFVGGLDDGNKNVVVANIIFGVYEALMEHIYFQDDFNEGSAQQVLDLFENYDKLSKVLKEKATTTSSGDGKKKGNDKKKAADKPRKEGKDKVVRHSANIKVPPSLISLKMTASLLSELMFDTRRRVHLKVLRGSQPFVRYLVTVASQKIKQLKVTGICSDSKDEDPTMQFHHLCVLGRALFYYYNDELKDTTQSETASPAVALPSFCLETFASVVSLVCTNLKDRRTEFFMNIERHGDISKPLNEKEIRDGDEVIQVPLRKLKRCIIRILSEDEDYEHSDKDITCIINILEMLTSTANLKGTIYSQVKGWVEQLMHDHVLDDTQTFRAIMNLLLNVSKQVTETGISDLHKVAEEVLLKIGVINEAKPKNATPSFAMITSSTVLTTATMLVQHVDHLLDYAEWALTLTRANISSLSKDLTLGTQDGDVHPELSKLLDWILNVIQELVKCNISPGEALLGNLLRLLSHLYKILTALVKYYIFVYSVGSGRLCQNFVTLVRCKVPKITKDIHGFLANLQKCDAKGNKENKKDNTFDKAKVLKENRLIPALVYTIEHYEKFLSQLSKKAEGNLTRHMNLAPFRGLKLSETREDNEEDEEGRTVTSESEQAESAEDGEIEDEDDEEANEETDEDDEPEQPRKKRRT